MESNSAIMMESDDLTIPFGEENEPKKLTKRPISLFFHLLFKTLSILAYILFGFFSSGFIVTFVVIIALLSLDFWTTKNITGRLLVGLRWWNYVDEEGQSHWVYESRQTSKPSRVQQSGVDSPCFWGGLMVSQTFWTLFVLAALVTFKLQWMMVACVGFCLNGANVYGYIRCKFGSKNTQAAASSFLGKQALSAMFSRFTSTPTS